MVFSPYRQTSATLFVCVAFVCLLASAALTVSIVAATRQSEPAVEPAPGSGDFLLSSTCTGPTFSQQNGQLVATYRITENDAPVAGIPYSDVSFTPGSLATVNVEMSDAATQEDGTLQIFVDTADALGFFTISIAFNSLGLQSEECGTSVLPQELGSPTPSPPISGPDVFSLTADCATLLLEQEDGQIVAIYTLTRNGEAFSGVPYSSLTIEPPELALLDEQLSDAETTEDGGLAIFVDTTPTTGTFTVTVAFADFNVAESCTANIV